MKHVYLSVAAICVTLLAACTPTPRNTDFDVDAALAQCDRQVHRTLAQLTESGGGAIDTTMMPRNVAPGDSAWSCRPLCAEEWCSGFWPGVLWLDYEAQLLQEHTDAAALQVRRAAIDATLAMHRVVDRPVFDHDLGFLVFCSAGTALRVIDKELAREDLPADQRTEDEAVRDRFRTLCLRAADSLATLFRPTVGTILSWPRNVQMFGGHNTIMDNMINLEMLCWAGLSQVAVSHAETTRQHHFRPDGSSYHVAVYDTLDGHFIHGVTHQGLADSSTWARGQAWAVYGFTMMYRFTRDQRFLDMAERATDYFLSRLPDDYIPYWDFDDPRITTSPATPAAPSETVAPRDASAAAVVASALLELQDYVEAERQQTYLDAARHILQSLSSDAYQAAPQNAAFLLHSTGNLPAGSEIDVPIIYADYYYLEALNRYKELYSNQR